MKNIIKTLVLSFVILSGIFASAGTVSAQTANTSCNSATFSGVISDTGNAATTAWFEYGTSQTAVSNGSGSRTGSQTFTANNSSFSQTVTGLSQNTTYYYRLVMQNAYGSANGGIRSITTSACAPVGEAPTASTSGATGIGYSSATLNGSMNGNGYSTSAWFEYGTSQSFGNSTNQASYGSGYATYNRTISGLSQNTTYYFRAVAQNAYGTRYGETRSFRTNYFEVPQGTRPAVTTSSATGISSNSASVSGYVNGNGYSTSAWFEYGTTPSYGYTTGSVNYGTGYSNMSAHLPNLASNTTYYFRAVAQNAYGTEYGNQISFNTNGSYNPPQGNRPSVTTSGATGIGNTYATLNGYVNGNGYSTTSWFEYGVSQNYGYTTNSVNYGSGYSSYNAYLSNLAPNTTYWFRSVAQNGYGYDYGSPVTFTTTGSTYVYNPPVTGNTSAPTAVTTLATQITTTSAQLNSLIFTNASVGSTAWFEWGTTAGLGYKTASASVGNLPSIRHADTISGLTDGVTYYYRIVAENQYGRSNGLIYTFVAGGTTPVRDNTVVINRPTTTPITTVVNYGTGIESLIKLSVDGGFETITAGERRTYEITWKNESKLSLEKVALRVILPESLTFVSGSRGSFSSAYNTLTVDVKTLAPGETGNVVVVVDAKRTIKQGDLVVTVAHLAYTTPAGIQGAADAYSSQTGIASQNNLGASIFGAGSFLPTTLLGWLILVLLLLVLVFLGSHLYGRFSTPGGAPSHH